MIYLLNCRRFSALLGALAMLVVVQVLQLSGAPLNEMTPSKAAQELTAKGWRVMDNVASAK